MLSLGALRELGDLFQGSVEQVFMTEVGICDPRVTDYVGRLMLDFVHVDQIFRLQTVDGEVIREVSQIEAQARLGDHLAIEDRRRLVNRYIGDLTLFWAGVYPEALRPRLAGADRLIEYVQRGKRSYDIASELSQPGSEPPADLLRRLSCEFEACVHGLHLVRASWERLAASPRTN
ncbi:MAG TPA: hypothetical protein PKC49_06930 [Phycisphaerae bacterium]|nr:hypothetical protein [Phycisphaerae bacterium]